MDGPMWAQHLYVYFWEQKVPINCINKMVGRRDFKYLRRQTAPTRTLEALIMYK